MSTPGGYRGAWGMGRLRYVLRVKGSCEQSLFEDGQAVTLANVVR